MTTTREGTRDRDSLVYLKMSSLAVWSFQRSALSGEDCRTGPTRDETRDPEESETDSPLLKSVSTITYIYSDHGTVSFRENGRIR